jgi:hypothetical protein
MPVCFVGGRPVADAQNDYHSSGRRARARCIAESRCSSKWGPRCSSAVSRGKAISRGRAMRCLPTVARMSGSKRRHTHRAPRAAHGSDSRGYRAAPMQSRKQASAGPGRVVCHGSSRAESPAGMTAFAQWRAPAPAGVPWRTCVSQQGRLECCRSAFDDEAAARTSAFRRVASRKWARRQGLVTGSDCGSPRAASRPSSGQGVGDGSSDFAGCTGACNVAFRGITADPTPAIQAVAGSAVDAAPVGGLAQSRNTSLDRVTSESGTVHGIGGRGHRASRAGTKRGKCVSARRTRGGRRLSSNRP